MPELYFDPRTLDEAGCPAWISALAGEEHDPNHLVHVVRDLEPADALELLGVDRQAIRPCELPTRNPGELTPLARAAIHPLNPTVVLMAARIGDWTFIYDDLGETLCLWHLPDRPPMDATEALSIKGKVAATGNIAITGQVGFTYAVNGKILVQETEDVPSSTELGENTPAKVRAAVKAAGIFDSGDDYGVSMRMICALAGLPRTLDELRQIPLLVAPLDSRPYLFRP